MVTAVIAKIISMQSSLTVSENEIAQYVINHAEAVVTSTITSVAKSTDTSEASINRFCKKIGFKGFNSFKIALAQENFYNSMNEQSSRGDEGFIATVSQDYRQMLVNTSAMLDETTVQRAVEQIKRAPHIYIFAFSYTSAIAQELELKLSMVGIPARAITDINSMRVFASNVQTDDLAVVIVPTILMRDIYHVVTTCKDKGAKILSITSYDSPKLSDLVDFKFVTSDKITTRNSVSLSNSLMFLFVIDVLYSLLLESDRALRQKKLNSDAILNNQQMMDNYLFEY